VKDRGNGEDGGVGTQEVTPRGQREVPRISLLVSKGPDAGLSFVSKGACSVIGTHDSADLVLHDPTISRFHCEITTHGPRVTIRDLGSRNGTLVDKTSVVEAYLHSGATVALGRTELRFDLDPEPCQVPISERSQFGSLVGASPAMRRVFAVLERAAATDSTVLLEGETGTGKEATAESIHREGLRAAGPLVVIDCSSLPPTLLENELFGHERGAFTGAVEAREGAFEAADGGTVFLDEIGELGPDLQPKLLRVLERREIKRIGSPSAKRIDVRVIAATNRNLRAEVNAHRFRADLYYRLAVLNVRLPPLRERPEDLPLLVEHLLGELGAKQRPEAALLRQPAFQAELQRHDWPGNVRELRNYLERCLALHEHLPLGEDAAPVELGELGVEAVGPLGETRELWLRRFERAYLVDLLRRNGESVTASARAAGISRVHLHRLLDKHGIR